MTCANIHLLHRRPTPPALIYRSHNFRVPCSLSTGPSDLRQHALTVPSHRRHSSTDLTISEFHAVQAPVSLKHPAARPASLAGSPSSTDYRHCAYFRKSKTVFSLYRPTASTHLHISQFQSSMQFTHRSPSGVPLYVLHLLPLCRVRSASAAPPAHRHGGAATGARPARRVATTTSLALLAAYHKQQWLRVTRNRSTARST